MYNYHTCRYFRRTVNRIALSTVLILSAYLIYAIVGNPFRYKEAHSAIYAQKYTPGTNRLSKRDVVKLYQHYQKRVSR